MNKILTLALVASAAALSLQAQAQPQGREMGRVLSVTPVSQQVAVPQQVCNNETVYSGGRQTSGAGAVLGAVAGGLVGNAIGGGSGRALATGVGVIGGALLGNQVEGGSPGYQNVQRCTTQTRYDNQFLGYDVVYEYGGRQYTTRTQSDPGQWIPVTVQPAVAPAPSYAPGYSYYEAPQPAVVVTETPVYATPVYPAPAIGATIEYRDGGGWDRGHHRGWR
ncbi:MAG: glycine zipper 2TM domain-containing protein [Comamonas sp.]|nr:glycine zipper 2TM domain-containing protein [Comamonas sp.]